MDTTTGIIVFIFVITILHGAMTGGGGPLPSVAPREIVQSVDVILPHPGYEMGVLGDPAFTEKLAGFIQRRNRKLGGETAQTFASLIQRYSEEYRINPRLITGLIARESSFNPFAISEHGALGLGQLLPQTAASLKVGDPFDAAQNIQATVRYFKLMLDRWKNHPQQVAYALASYFEGYGQVSRNGGFMGKSKAYIEDIIRYAQGF